MYFFLDFAGNGIVDTILVLTDLREIKQLKNRDGADARNVLNWIIHNETPPAVAVATCADARLKHFNLDLLRRPLLEAVAQCVLLEVAYSLDTSATVLPPSLQQQLSLTLSHGACRLDRLTASDSTSIASSRGY